MRRHVNEFVKSGLASTGRIAGTGIASDDYSEESWPDNVRGTRPVKEHAVKMGRPKKEDEEPEVITYQISREEAEKL